MLYATYAGIYLLIHKEQCVCLQRQVQESPVPSQMCRILNRTDLGALLSLNPPAYPRTLALLLWAKMQTQTGTNTNLPAACLLLGA